MDLSLIICTRNRAEQLRACLASVSQLETDTEWELVIVNNGSSDNTENVATTFRKAASVPTLVVDEPRKGLGRARNAGIAAASGSIFVFTDDDCYPEPDFRSQVWKTFEDSEIGYMGGRVLLYDLEDAPVTIKTDSNQEPILPFSYVRAGQIHGANMAFRRKVVEAIGTFDSMLGAGTPFPSEDCDLIARASAGGWSGGYFPGPTVYHHHGRRGVADVLAVRRAYDRG